MIISATFSKPSASVETKLGMPYIKIRFWKGAKSALNAGSLYEAEFFTQKQSFRKHFSEDELNTFIEENAGSTFKAVVVKTESEEITTLSNRHGEIKTLRRKLKSGEREKNLSAIKTKNESHNRSKNYLLKEGMPVPFLIELGVMTKDGKVVAAKYDKFRQINRFLEFIDDAVKDICGAENVSAAQQTFSGAESTSGAPHTPAACQYTKDHPLTIIDFGSGKSYLTFAVHYYLSEIKKIPVRITGLDLKKDVIENCSRLAQKLNCSGLKFLVGDIADYNEENSVPDIIITLHACDTATDYALKYAVQKGARAILSVPCCQHEINLQLGDSKHQLTEGSPFNTLLKYGIIQERFSALVTDALRAEYLEQQGYSVQLLEFIDMSHTPKNIMIRAVKKQKQNEKAVSESRARAKTILDALQVSQKLYE